MHMQELELGNFPGKIPTLAPPWPVVLSERCGANTVASSLVVIISIAEHQVSLHVVAVATAYCAEARAYPLLKALGQNLSSY